MSAEGEDSGTKSVPSYIGTGRPGRILPFKWVAGVPCVEVGGVWTPTKDLQMIDNNTTKGHSEPQPRMKHLEGDSATRKAAPMFRGLKVYFPDALAAVAALSLTANEKHNPGEPLHWAKDKSTDQEDCIERHLADIAKGITWDPENKCNPRVAVAWRALASLQAYLEGEDEDGK